MIYFDSAATTPIDESVAEYLAQISKTIYGNPSSIHKSGQEAKAVIENSRRQISKCINALPNEIYFTGGGSESNNLVLKGYLKTGDHLIISSIEHPAIIKPAQELQKHGIELSIIEPNKYGEIKLKKIINKIKSNTKLVSIMHVNNELGTTNKIEDFTNYLNKENITFHTDAVQSAGKIKIDIKQLGCDFLSASAHKFHGPKGIGFLFIKDGLKLNPQITGGGQEKNIRAGTENISGIAAMGLALEIATNNMIINKNHILELENQFFKELKSHNIFYRRNGIHQIPGLCNITIFDVSGQSLIINLDLKGYAISYGAACASGSSKPSQIHNKIGMDSKEAECTIRISISKMNTKNEVSRLTETLSEIITQIKKKIIYA